MKRDSILRSLKLSCVQLKIESAYISSITQQDMILHIVGEIQKELELLSKSCEDEDAGIVSLESGLHFEERIVQRLKVSVINLAILAYKIKDTTGIAVIANFFERDVLLIEEEVKKRRVCLTILH